MTFVMVIARAVELRLRLPIGVPGSCMNQDVGFVHLRIPDKHCPHQDNATSCGNGSVPPRIGDGEKGSLAEMARWCRSSDRQMGWAYLQSKDRQYEEK